MAQKIKRKEMSPTPIRDARLGTTHIPDRDLSQPSQEKKIKIPKEVLLKVRGASGYTTTVAHKRKRLPEQIRQLKFGGGADSRIPPKKTGPR